MPTPVSFSANQLEFFVPSKASVTEEVRSAQVPVDAMVTAHATNAAFVVQLVVWRQELSAPSPSPGGFGPGPQPFPFAQVARLRRVMTWEDVAESDGITPLSVRAGDVLAVEVTANAPGDGDGHVLGQLIIAGTTWVTQPIQLDLFVSEILTTPSIVYAPPNSKVPRLVAITEKNPQPVSRSATGGTDVLLEVQLLHGDPLKSTVSYHLLPGGSLNETVQIANEPFSPDINPVPQQVQNVTFRLLTQPNSAGDVTPLGAQTVILVEASFGGMITRYVPVYLFINP